MPVYMPGENIKLFADDTNIFVTGKSLNQLEEEGNKQLFSINEWLTANKLHLNKEKTCYTVFSPTKTKPCSINIKLNGDRLKQVSSCRYLGVVVDDELKWTAHIETVLQKLNRLVGICYKLCYKLPDWCLHDIFFAFVHSHVLYCIEIYGNTYGSYLDKLTKVYNKLLRILQKTGRNCCNESLYVQYNTLPPVQLFNYQVISLVHKTLFTPYLLPTVFQQYFSLNKLSHNYDTRNQSLQLTQHQSRHGFQTLKFKGSQLWNRLPSDLQETESPSVFRQLLKYHLIYDPM